jgi:hypothetical protein
MMIGSGKIPSTAARTKSRLTATAGTRTFDHLRTKVPLHLVVEVPLHCPMFADNLFKMVSSILI